MTRGILLKILDIILFWCICIYVNTYVGLAQMYIHVEYINRKIKYEYYKKQSVISLHISR